MKKNIQVIESPEIPQEIYTDLSNDTNKSNQLAINFDSDSWEPINKFLQKNKSGIYLDTDYKININLEQENFELFIFLVDCIDSAHLKIINTSDKNKLLFVGKEAKNNTIGWIWNISVCKNIFFNYPFTLGDIIYLPIQYIEKCLSSNTPKQLTETLIHEKLHVSQRQNEDIWEKYIEEKGPEWIKLTLKNEIFHLLNEFVVSNPSKLIDISEYQFISNPDTWYDNFKYIYKNSMKNKLLYGHYVYNKKTKKIHKEYFLVDELNKQMIRTVDLLEQEHPYEIYAYKISDEIMAN
jgi:hypothetical protein